MAVVLVSTPDQFALTKGGRMGFRFSGSGRYETRGTRAVNVLMIGQPVNDGTKLLLRWKGQTHTLTARANPTGDGEFPAGDGSNSYVDRLVAYFKGYFAFREDFLVTRDTAGNFGFGVVLTARQAGAAYTMTAVQTPAGLPFEQRTLGTDPLIRERYGVYVELWLQKPGRPGTDLDEDFARIDLSHVECDEDGNCEYDAGDVLHGYLQADIPNDTVQVAQTSHRTYYVAYAEAYGQFVRPGLIALDQVRHAYLGGADFEHRAGAGFSLEQYVKGGTTADDRALRFGGTARRVYRDEPAWLTFVNLRTDAPEPLSIDFFLKFDDQSTANVPASSSEAFPAGAKITYAVGIAQRNLLSHVPAGRFLSEYYVKIRTGSADYSRQYRFVVDYDYRPYRRSFAYQNSLGAFDVITTWGKGSAELNRFYDQAERSLGAGYQPTNGQFVDYNVALQQQVEVASGWQPKVELERWNDFYVSSVRLRATPKGLLAVGLTSKTIKQQKDGDTQFAHAFSYVYLHRDEFYTDDETPAQDQSLPPIAVPTGSITVTPATTVAIRDPTISDDLRNLTPAEIRGLKTLLGRPNPETIGFLTEQSGSKVFRPVSKPISFIELSQKPTTRDELGVADVPTTNETILQTLRLGNLKSRLKSWTSAVEPD